MTDQSTVTDPSPRVSPWRVDPDGAIVCKLCGRVKYSGHLPTCTEQSPAKSFDAPTRAVGDKAGTGER